MSDDFVIIIRLRKTQKFNQKIDEKHIFLPIHCQENLAIYQFHAHGQSTF